MAGSITLAGAGDMSVLAEMLTRLAGDLKAGGKFRATPEALARYGMGPDARFQALIAHDGGQAEGFSLFFPHFSTWRAQPGVYVQDLWVAPETRGSGLGERLLAATARHAAGEWDAGYLMLSVDAQNFGARRFYERLGFRPQEDDRPMALDGVAFARLQGTEAAA